MNVRHDTGRFAAVVVFAFLATVATTQVSAEPDKLQYELQERCGRRATEVFEKEYGSGFSEDDTSILTGSGLLPFSLDKTAGSVLTEGSTISELFLFFNPGYSTFPLSLTI